MTGPQRIRSSAYQRVLAGEDPDAVSASWPAVGDLVPGSDARLREVTFVLEVAHAGDEALIHLNGITDGHREDIRPALFDAVPGSRIRVLSYLLPDALVASYRFVALPRIPADIGSSREGWLSIHAAGRPDPRNPRRLPNPLGSWSSVLTMPGAPRDPAWDPVTSPRRRVAVDELSSSTLLRPESKSGVALLVLFDAEIWQGTGIVDALARCANPPAAVALVPSGSRDERSALLPHPDRVAALLSERVLPEVHRLIGPVAATDTVVAGQSYGALAAAGVAVLHPELAERAIVQSGSFHFRAGEQPRPPAHEPGDLVRRVRAMQPGALAGRRLQLQVGTEESNMLGQSRSFAEAAHAAGADISLDPWIGGHDYAWWRLGLLAAL